MTMRESDRMTDLRRTRPRAQRGFARLLKAGDLLHAPSAVLEVVGVDNSGHGCTGSATTLLYVLDEAGGRVVTRELRLPPQREVLRFREGESPDPWLGARETLW